MGCAWRAGTPGWAPGGVTSCRASSRKGGGLRCKTTSVAGRRLVAPCGGTGESLGGSQMRWSASVGPPWPSREIGSTAMYRAATTCVCVCVCGRISCGGRGLNLPQRPVVPRLPRTFRRGRRTIPDRSTRDSLGAAWVVPAPLKVTQAAAAEVPCLGGWHPARGLLVCRPQWHLSAGSSFARL